MSKIFAWGMLSWRDAELWAGKEVCGEGTEREVEGDHKFGGWDDASRKCAREVEGAV
jgi:hypothetical protein